MVNMTIYDVTGRKVEELGKQLLQMQVLMSLTGMLQSTQAAYIFTL
jgi:hypothetical protein